MLLRGGDEGPSGLTRYNAPARAVTTDNAGTPGVPHVVMTDSFAARSLRSGLAATVNGGADFTSSYEYDLLGRMTGLVQPGSSGGAAATRESVEFDYNSNGRMEAVHEAFSGTGSSDGRFSARYGRSCLLRKA